MTPADKFFKPIWNFCYFDHFYEVLSYHDNLIATELPETMAVMKLLLVIHQAPRL